MEYKSNITKIFFHSLNLYKTGEGLPVKQKETADINYTYSYAAEVIKFPFGKVRCGSNYVDEF